MRSDLTDITVVLDRSGSMASCREEAQNGVNHFIEDQKKQSGEAVFSLVQFDTGYDFVHRGVLMKDVPAFELVPRGMTALLDAVGRAVNETGERLCQMDDEDRPGLVVFVIVTDGKENSSHEFTKTQIKEMIERQSSQYRWQFTFLGANQDAFGEAGAIGINTAAAANYTPENSAKAFLCASANVGRMRAAVSRGVAPKSEYTAAERKLMG